MSYFKKKSVMNHYLTDVDRKRLAAIDSNPALEHRKCKFGLTLTHPSIEALIFIVIYGKDEDEIKEKAKKNLEFFHVSDKKWKIKSLEDLKSREDDNAENQ